MISSLPQSRVRECLCVFVCVYTHTCMYMHSHILIISTFFQFWFEDCSVCSSSSVYYIHVNGVVNGGAHLKKEWAPVNTGCPHLRIGLFACVCALECRWVWIWGGGYMYVIWGGGYMCALSIDEFGLSLRVYVRYSKTLMWFIWGGGYMYVIWGGGYMCATAKPWCDNSCMSYEEEDTCMSYEEENTCALKQNLDVIIHV